MSTQRRQSFAPSATSSKPRGIGKKRARSFAPGEARQLVPRKSILKSAFSFNIPKPNSGNDENDDTTVDFTADLTMGRKSLNKRVSFAVTKDVRIFEINEQNTNSSGAPSSSPTPSSPDPPPIPQLSNENDYPGGPGRRLSQSGRRRSSVGTEYGERSMSLDGSEGSDSPVNPDFLFQGDQSQDYSGSSDMEEDDIDMDMTEAVSQNIRRKRSLSMSHSQRGNRRSSTAFAGPSQLSSSPIKGDHEQVANGSGDMTTSSMASQESNEHLEFTIPLDQSFREPKQPSEAWLKLQAMANSSTASSASEDDGEDMELTDALSRLSKARESLNLAQVDEDDAGQPSFTSSEESMDMTDIGDRTMNLTGLMSGVQEMDISIPGDDGFDLSGFARRLQDEVQPDLSSPAVPPPAKVIGVFSAPSTSPARSPPRPPSDEQRTTAAPPPSRLKPPAVFVAPNASSPARPARSPTPSSPSKKRPAQDDEETDSPKPSPAKKRAIGLGKGAPLTLSQSLNKATSATPTPSQEDAPSSAPTKANSLRRPSGYFAQRRSLVPGGLSSSLGPQPVPSQPQDSSRLLPSGSTQRRASIAAVQPKAKSQVQNENIRPNFVTPPLPTIVVKEVLVSPGGSDVEEQEDGFMQGDEENDTQQWRAKVPPSPAIPSEPEGDDDEDEEVPPLSIEEFFMMTGIKFMDQLTIPRRSTIRPTQLQQSTSRGPGDTPLMSEYVAAMNVHIPQLELYSWVAKDLQTWIDNSKKIYQEAEDEVAKVTPSLFREYSLANEEGRSELLHQLKLIKANKHSAAKEKWYEWKYQWTENLLEMVEKGCVELEEDNVLLDETITQAEELVPALEQQHQQILIELERERSEVEEMKESDPAYLEELKVTIEVQNGMLDNYRADIAEWNAKVERLNEKFAELNLQKAENKQVIVEADRKITLHKSSTRAEVFRLKDELESLQALHSWRASKVAPDALELIYDNQFLVSIPCMKYHPDMSGVTITKIVDVNKIPRRDPFALFSEHVLNQAQEHVTRHLSNSSPKQLVESLGDFWTSCSQIRTQLRFLSIKYPLSLEASSTTTPKESAGFVAKASLLFHKQQAKAIVVFAFDNDLLANWPFAIRSLKCDVKIAYGSIDAEVVQKAVMQRLSEASVEDNHACLLDACVEATSRYE